MSKPVMITSDSTVDLSPELYARYNIKTVPLTIVLGGESYLDGVDFSTPQMFARYHKDGTLPETAAPSLLTFLDFFRAILDEGYEIVHVDISSELSGTFNTARLAAEELEGVYVVDSRMLSTGVGLLAIEGAECAAAGMSAKEIAEHLNGLTGKVSTSFVLDTLEFMWKGGRCTGVTAFGANLLRIKPGLEMKDGKLDVYKKYRGNMNNVYRQYISERLEGKKIRPGHIFITESGEIDDAVIAELMQLVKEKSGCKEVHHTVAGATIASHCGPKCLGVLFIEE